MASVYRPKDRGIYRIEFKDQHEKVRTISSGMKDRRSAEGLAHLLERDAERLQAGLLPLHPQVTGQFLGLAQFGSLRPWDDAVAAYLAELQRLGSDAKGQHVKGVRWSLARLQRECGWKTLADIRPDQFTAFLRKLAEQGKAPRTQNVYFAHLRGACNFWVRQEWMAQSPLANLKPVKVGQAGRRRLRRAYSLLELNRLCATASDRTALVYRVAAYSGFRRNELKKLRKEDCTPLGSRPCWHVDAARTKNGQPVYLPMTPECASELAPHWPSLPGGALLLCVPRKETFLRHRLKAGVAAQDERGRWADFHSLRYTFCALLSRVYPIEVVSKLMRHSSINLTIQVYQDLGLDRQGEGAWVLQPLTGKNQLPTAGPTAAKEHAA